MPSTRSQVSEFEAGAQTKERELRDFIDRVSAVTNQYLGRLEQALHEEDAFVDTEGEKGMEGDQRKENPGGSSQSARYLEMEKRAADAEAALQVPGNERRLCVRDACLRHGG